MENFDLGGTILGKIEEAKEKTGRINILITGKTGVGKSTLINSMFQGNLAETGQGRPCTQGIKEITKEGVPISIFDTRGLEVKEYKETLNELRNFISQKHKETDVNKQIHVAWICISEDSRRVEEADTELVNMLSEFVPVIAVITKARSDNGFQAKVKTLLTQVRNVVRVRALEEVIDDENITLPQMGLDKLADLTQEVIPEGRRNAFAAAQKASIKQKVSRAQKIVAGAAATALATGASPIPFSDALVLVPIEIGMLASISAVFGLDLSKSVLTTLVSSVIGSSAATIGGKAIVSGLLKFIPGVGTLAGAAISGTTASILTTTIGELYIATLSLLFEKSKGEPPKAEDIEKTFKEKLSLKKK